MHLSYWDWYPVFFTSYASFLRVYCRVGRAAIWWLLDSRYSSLSWGLRSSQLRAAISDDRDILVYWYGRKYSTSQFSFSSSMDCSTHQASLPITNSWSLLKLMSIESVITSNHLILCHPLLLVPSIVPSIRVFFNESALRIRWPKYWSFSFSIHTSKEYLGFISFWIDWFDLLAVQGTFKSLLQHHSLKTSVLWLLDFFMVQFSHPYMTIGKTIVLTIWIFVGQVMSLLFNTLSFSHRVLVLPKSNHFFKFHGCSHHLQWFWSSRKKKSVTASSFSPFIIHEMMGSDAMILVF